MEFVGLAPDVIVTGTAPAAIVLQRETHSIPVVFVNLADPVGTGLVRSLANPGGNMTATAITWRWLELLKEIAPRCGPRSCAGLSDLRYPAAVPRPSTSKFGYGYPS
jgi:ABC-type uncharacterized transport system substrate-binding protein